MSPFVSIWAHPQFFRSILLILFVFLCCLGFCFVCLRPVSCAQCCLCLWIVHSLVLPCFLKCLFTISPVNQKYSIVGDKNHEIIQFFHRTFVCCYPMVCMCMFIFLFNFFFFENPLIESKNFFNIILMKIACHIHLAPLYVGSSFPTSKQYDKVCLWRVTNFPWFMLAIKTTTNI